MFLTDTPHAMTPNGRVSLPKRFQKELSRDDAGNLCGVLTMGFEGCLFIFSLKGFKRAQKNQNTDVFVSPEVRKRQRQFYSRAYHFTLDGSGRLVVPEAFRKAAGLEGDVMMVGAGARAEIWDPLKWKEENTFEGSFDDLCTGLDPEGEPGKGA
jgi:MraZ protein